MAASPDFKTKAFRRVHPVSAAFHTAPQWLEAALSFVADAVITTDKSGALTFMNGAAEVLTGWLYEEAFGKPLESVFRIVDDSIEPYRALSNPVERCLNHGETIKLPADTSMVAKDGTACAIDCFAAPMMKDAGETAGSIVVFRGSAGGRRRIQSQKAGAGHEEEAERRKDEFLAMLSHELRNPLAPLSNAVEVLRQGGGIRQQEACGVIERQVKHLCRLVDDLLDISRIATGRIQLDRECVDLKAAIACSLERAQPLFSKKQQSIEVSLPDIPLCVEGDSGRLEQVLDNLLNNAGKYSETGGHVRLSAAREDEDVVVRVSDDGVGLDQSFASNIFELFQQAERSRIKGEGLGIGLALVKKLLELHGGSIEANSEGPNRGSEFVVRLPAVEPRRGGEAADERSNAAGRPARVLVVDDHPDAARMLALLLERDGHEVQIAKSGPEALEQAARFLPEYVLLDIGLPGIDGYEVARRLRAKPELQGALLAAVTGHGQAEDRERTREAGFDFHFVKPFDYAELDALLKQRP